VSVFSLSCCLYSRKAVVFVKEGEEEVEAALQRLDQLTQEEAQSTAAETLEVGHSLVRGITMISEQAHLSSNPASIEYPSTRRRGIH
jgi:hypothetical protein